MNVGEYSERQQSITAAVVSLILSILEPFRGPRLDDRAWVNLLEVLYPHVEQARRESASLGRDFYDSQRDQQTSLNERHDSYLAEYEFDWFMEAMRPAKKGFVQPGADEDDTSMVALRVAKEVENGGRRTMLRAVESDPVEPRWARVATGRETCAFCTMLVSRGPVYTSAEDAGLDADDTTAQELFAEGDEESLDELMTRWHPGCDCKVVPVFDRKNWPGRDAYLEAEELWKKYAQKVNNNSKLRTPQNGNQYGTNNEQWSRGEAILAAMRRDFESGELDAVDYSIAA